MPYKTVYEPAPKNMSLEVFEKLPDGWMIELESFIVPYKIANKWEDKNKLELISAYHCHWCNGWIMGEPNEYHVNTMDYHHPLSGRHGTEFYCIRCGQEIAFFGQMA